MKNPDHRWFDSKYVQHTLGGLDCFPAYMQVGFFARERAWLAYVCVCVRARGCRSLYGACLLACVSFLLRAPAPRTNSSLETENTPV